MPTGCDLEEVCPFYKIKLVRNFILSPPVKDVGIGSICIFPSKQLKQVSYRWPFH